MKRKKDEDKGREKEPTAVPSPPTIRTPLPNRNIRHMQGNNKRNGNGKETGMENQRGKDTGYPDNPHSLRPKEATLPYREKGTSPNDKREGGATLFLPAKRRKPSLPVGKRLFSLPPAEKSQLPKSQKTPLPLAKSRASFSLLPKGLPSLPQKKQRLSPHR